MPESPYWDYASLETVVGPQLRSILQPNRKKKKQQKNPRNIILVFNIVFSKKKSMKDITAFAASGGSLLLAPEHAPMGESHWR